MSREGKERIETLPLEARMFLSEGRTLDAIKSVRASHGLDLAEAKNWIDAHIANDPLLRGKSEAQRRDTRRTALTVFLCVDAILVAAAIWYFFFRQ